MDTKHIISAALFTLAVSPAFASTGKTTICHIPPGNPSNAHAITISNSAVQTHIDRHGDTEMSPGDTCGTATAVVPNSTIAAAVEICSNAASTPGRRIDVTGTGSVQTNGSNSCS